MPLHDGRVWHDGPQAVEVMAFLFLRTVCLRHRYSARLHACPTQWGRLSAPTGVAASQQTHQHLYALARAEMLGDEVCRILLTEDFAKIDSAATDSLLDPQQMRVYMEKLAKTLASTNTIAADESVHTRIGMSCPRSLVRLWNPRPMPDPRRLRRARLRRC